MSLETAIAELRRQMSLLGIASLTVEAVASAAPAPAQRTRVDNIATAILRVMEHGDPMTISHIQEATASELGFIPAKGTVRSTVWVHQQAGLVVLGDEKAPSTSGRRAKTYRRVLPD